jgi:hypothetical protein
MIDPLLSVAMPPPLRTSPNEASPGTPSFLQWALGSPQPGMEGDAFPRQNAHDPQFEVVAEPLVLDPVLLESLLLDPVVPGHVVPGPVLPDPVLLDSIAGMEAASAAPALDQMQWRERLSSVVEFHVRNPQGERELIAMPWRLMASGALAQSMDGQGPVDPAVAMVTSMHAAAGFAHAVAARSLAATGHADAAGLRNEAAGSNATVQLSAMPRATGTDDPMQLQPLPTSSPAAAEWLARWMKWIERDGRDPIVLLRDFRIDDDEARRIVDGLRAFAQEHGVGLDRIVVNGREFWRRPDPSQRQE